MHNPTSNPSTNDGPNSRPKVKKYDELRYGKTVAPAQVSAADRLRGFFRTDNSSFWTGILIGGAATFVLTSETVKRVIVKSFARAGEKAKKEIKEVRKTAVKEKESEKTEKK